jgi:DNA-directed RNA polymerase sigma subunit (sigma70/sigma32)
MGPTFNVSRERIRQIERDGLNKLRAHASTAKLDRVL